MKRELRDVLRLLEELERALREKEMFALTLGAKSRRPLPCSIVWKTRSARPRSRR